MVVISSMSNGHAGGKMSNRHPDIGAKRRATDEARGQVASAAARQLPASARLLVLGAEQVGKSAAIVRFTTGRFIHEYSSSTQDWLYIKQQCHHPQASASEQTKREHEHFPGKQSPATTRTVELLELKDRVGQCETTDDSSEFSRKVRWANAFVIVYSLTSAATFARASRYLELIAPQRHQAKYDDGDDKNSEDNATRRSISHHMSPPNSSNAPEDFTCRQQQQQCCPAILLLGNKRDLAPAARQVPYSDGCELAARHRCLFAELSISESAQPIESSLLDLIARVPTTRDIDQSARISQRHARGCQSQLIKWQPRSARNHEIEQHPIRSSLVTSSGPLVSQCSISSQVVAARATSVGGEQPMLAASYRRLFNSRPSSSGSLAGAAEAVLKQRASVASGVVGKQTAASTGGRYGQFKSSFRKASLAIVSGKTLASKASAKTSASASGAAQVCKPLVGKENNRAASLSSGSNPSLDSTSGRETGAALKPNKPSNWIMSRFARQDSSCPDAKLAGQPDAPAFGQEQPPARDLPPTSRFKRPLFKYKNRLMTLAFEPNFSSDTLPDQTLQQSDSVRTITSGCSVDCARAVEHSTEQCSPTSQHNPRHSYHSHQQRQQADPYNPSAGFSSGRSSSSLSTSDTYHSSLFVVCEENQHGGARQSCSSLATSAASLRGRANAESNTPGDGRGSMSACSARDSPRSTLSRASSTFGSNCSAGCDDNDEPHLSLPPYHQQPSVVRQAAAAAAAARPISFTQSSNACASKVQLASSTNVDKKQQDQQQPVKTRFQVVKAVQVTLTNLAKSTRAQAAPSVVASASPAQAVKRSFCQALMGSSIGIASARVCEPTVASKQAVPVELVQIESIQRIPAVVGYCK